MHQVASEAPSMFMNILNKDSKPWFTPTYVFTTTSYDDCLSDYTFSFILEQCMTCDVYGLKWVFLQSNGMLYITDNGGGGAFQKRIWALKIWAQCMGKIFCV